VQPLAFANAFGAAVVSILPDRRTVNPCKKNFFAGIDFHS
jgi:hypothetical protein